MIFLLKKFYMIYIKFLFFFCVHNFFFLKKNFFFFFTSGGFFFPPRVFFFINPGNREPLFVAFCKNYRLHSFVMFFFVPNTDCGNRHLFSFSFIIVSRRYHHCICRRFFVSAIYSFTAILRLFS